MSHETVFVEILTQFNTHISATIASTTYSLQLCNNSCRHAPRLLLTKKTNIHYYDHIVDVENRKCGELYELIYLNDAEHHVTHRS